MFGCRVNPDLPDCSTVEEFQLLADHDSRHSYDGFNGLPKSLRDEIISTVGPADPESWVKTPVPELGGKSFLEVINHPNGFELASRYLASVTDAQSRWRSDVHIRSAPRAGGSKVVSVLSGATGTFLLAFVLLRLVQDSALLRRAVMFHDPIAGPLLGFEITILAVVAVLGVAAGVIARRNWAGRNDGRIPGITVFILILVGSSFFALRGIGVAQAVGWMTVVLSASVLVALMRGPRKKTG